MRRKNTSQGLRRDPGTTTDPGNPLHRNSHVLSYLEDDKLKKHDRAVAARSDSKRPANIYSTHRDSEFKGTLLEHKPRRAEGVID